MMAGLASGLVYFSFTSIEPILAQRLIEFDLSQMEIGFFFAICPLFYITGSMMVQYVPKQIERRVTLSVGAVLSFIGFLFVGPS